MSDLIREALQWAESGVPVFPCNKDKAPLTANGFYDAQTDPDKVRKLFEFYGDSAKMIGGRMGDGIFAVDVDLYKGPHVGAWLKAQIDDGTLVDTRTHKTKSGGLHFLYEGDVGCCAPVDGVEVKGDGGYIILPGTPGYTVEKEGLAKAPDSLMEVVRFSISNTRGAAITQLESAILSGKDFHNSLTQLAAKLAARGDDHATIQGRLMSLLMSSTASQPGHDRHGRWLKVMADDGGELSRIATSAYRKFNDDALAEEFNDLGTTGMLHELAEVNDALFNPTPPLIGEEPIKVYDDDKWPFETGYFADEDHNLADQNFTMYPIFAENETVVLFAEPKTGKTAIALTTALCIACGFDLGALKVAGAGPTLYYGLEGTRAIRLRVAAWKKKKKEEGVELPERVPMYVVEGHANFLKEEKRKDEAAKIIAANNYSIKAGAGPLKAVYLDTLTKAMSGGDQNSVEDTSHLFELIGLLRSGGVTATVIFVHHKSRQGNARGSTNIEAEPDVLLDISKKNDTVALRVARARSIEDGATFHFGLTGVDLGATKQGHPLAGVYAAPLEHDAGVDAGLDDVVAIQRLGERRKIITQLGKNPTAAEVVDAWFANGLIEGRKSRGGDAAPTLESATAQEALSTVVDKIAGTPYGNYLIRVELDSKKGVVAFHVGNVS